MSATRYEPPNAVDETPVEILDDPLDVNGERWVTLVPDGDDDRLWEFSLTTGRTVQVR